MKIALVVFDEFTDLDLFLPWDLLNRVAEKGVGDHSDWQVRILGTAETHISVAGLRIPVSGMVEEAADADAVVVVSGKGVHPLLEDAAYLARVPLNPEKQLIGAMCSGALLLAAKGLLEGKTATTYPTSQKKMSSRYGVEVVEESFVQQGNIATAAGCLAGIELSAWLIRKLAGPEVAEKVLASVQPVGSQVTIAQ